MLKKENLLHFVTAVSFVVLIALEVSCASSPPAEEGGILPMDRAIMKAARDIEESVEPNQKIALLHFSSPSEQFSEYALEELASQLVKGKKLIVVDRTELDLIKQEADFQMSGEVSDESVLALGKILGAQLIVSGSLRPTGDAYRIRFRVLNVESAVLVATPSADISAGEDRVDYLLDGKGAIKVETQPE